ncbi:MAG: phosphosulfolactate synthase [Gammaproteobacteria bacterium]|nr:phosphosulfolactate synthase [Gammaproteobacteria bacterium]
MSQRAFAFLPLNARPGKPRERGITEIRGPYYTVMGQRYLSDILETMGDAVDTLKFSGGAFSLMPRERVKELIDLAHGHDVTVSTGGFMEYVLSLRSPELVDRYIAEARELGFDILELSVGFITLPSDDLVRLVKRVKSAGLKPKPEVGIQFGAGGDTPTEELATEGTKAVSRAIELARKCLDAGAWMIMIESEGITENVREWRTDVVSDIADQLGLENVMFEAADPPVFQWYIKNYGPEVNVFVDHSQIVQLEALRRGIWGPQSLFGRVVTYKEE